MSAREDVALEAARQALFGSEFARTGVTRPVNGARHYSWVQFYGERVEFNEPEYAIPSERDAGTGQAAAYADKINQGMLDVAKRAADAAIAALAPQHATEISAAVAKREAEIVAWLRSDATKCNCAAHSEAECACGAWSDFKRVYETDIADAIERHDHTGGENNANG